MSAYRPPARPGGKFYGEDLFWYCQWLAETRYPATSGQGKRPSGALIYYIVRLLLLRDYPGAVIEPDAALVSSALAERFLELAPQIARRLAIELKHALRLIDRKQVADELQRLMRSFARLTLPHLSWSAEHHVGIYEALRQRLQNLWETYWQQAQVHHLALLLPRLRPAYLLVTPVAPASVSGKTALKLLRRQLEEDRRRPLWVVPPPDCYLYDEPLQDWLLRPLLSGQLFIDLCKVLAELTLAVPALARKRSAELGVTENDSLPPEAGTLKQEVLRRIPVRPQGTATGAAIAFYAIAAWRVARQAVRAAQGGRAHPAGAKPGKPDEPTPPDPAQPEDSGDDAPAGSAAHDENLILPDQRLMPLSQFQRLLAFAMRAAEHLLWDDTLAVRALPTPSPEQRLLQRQLLLSARLHRQYDYLDQKERLRRASTQAALPAWTEWETRRDSACDDIALRLAGSIAPEAITSANLPDLLRVPTAALVSQYLYQMPFGAWLRDALHAHLLDGAALLRWCQTLAEALAEKLGAWPPNTPGAPRTVEQAARAIFWHVKLALEARIDRLPGFAAPASADLPQRADGGLVIWLGSTLPPEALELATVLAPLVTRVLYHSAWEAASQGEALFVALIKNRDPRSFKQMTDDLMQRAEDLKLPNSADAVLQALEKLERLLEHLILPNEISLKQLDGDKFIPIPLDIIIDYHYNIDHGSYQFIGDFRSFVKSFVRPKDTRETSRSDFTNTAAPAKPQVTRIALDPAAENEAALRLLELLLHHAQTPQDSELAQDAQRLIEYAFTVNSGRQLIERFARQGKVVAIEIIKLWQADTLPAEGAEPAISPRLGKKQMKQQIALVRFLASPAVQQSPALRRAVSDLFEIPMGIEAPQAPGLRLGTLEHLAPWTTRKALREEALRILKALAQVSPTQRKALCARLLAQEQIVLTLSLLQQRGWPRPLWLRSPAAEPNSPQNFLHARQSWLRHLPENDTSWRARALMAEWLHTQFWSHTWSAHLHVEHIACFHLTFLNALHPRLRAVFGAAWTVASEQELAPFLEVIGVEGCLPPQLPAQLDDPVYFEAMWDCLAADVRLLYQPSTPGEPGEQQLEWLRQDWQVARFQTHIWFLTLAGLADENEQRVLLAAMSLANGNARVVRRWIAGQRPTAAEAQQLLYHLRHWNPHTSITAQDIPDLLSRAAERVRPAWMALGAAPFL